MELVKFKCESGEDKECCTDPVTAVSSLRFHTPLNELVNCELINHCEFIDYEIHVIIISKYVHLNKMFYS